jgi:glycosyltransferase involved in cell wall biosynthesis
MANTPHPRLVMLGPELQAHGSIGAVVEAYRTHGLFKRWPIEYLATHGAGGARRNAAAALSALRRLVALLARERGLVMHAHAAAGWGFWREALFMALAIAARCPFVLQLHGGGFQRFHDEGSGFARWTIGFLLEQAACVLVPCESSRSWVRSIARRAQVECVPDPVVPAEAPQDARRPNLVLFLGRLEAAKGVFDLLDAVSALRPAVPDVRLLCAGDGDRAAVARYAAGLGIADAVKCTRWVGPSGKRALLESAAVFALPSYEEGLPMSLLEAMAAGVPAVVAPVGGVPEVVVDGVSGLFAAPGDVATLQRLLRKLLLDRKLGARIGAAARESARRRCAPERSLARLGALYAELGLAALAEPAVPKAAV